MESYSKVKLLKMELITHKKINIQENKQIPDFSIKRFYFTLNDFLYSKEFPINFNYFDYQSYNIFYILSSKNKMYETYLGEIEYKLRAEKCNKIMMENGILQKIEKNHLTILGLNSITFFCENEKTLHELCLLYRFSTLFVVRKDITYEALLLTFNKFSFKSIFDLKRWKSFIEAQLFFDGEHFYGTISLKDEHSK